METKYFQIRAIVDEMFHHLQNLLIPLVQVKMRAAMEKDEYDQEKFDEYIGRMRFGNPEVSEWDAAALLRFMVNGTAWHSIFHESLGYFGKSWASELRSWRNEWAHPTRELTSADASRAVDTFYRLLQTFSSPAEMVAAEDLKRRLDLLIGNGDRENDDDQEDSLQEERNQEHESERERLEDKRESEHKKECGRLKKERQREHQAERKRLGRERKREHDFERDRLLREREREHENKRTRMKEERDNDHQAETARLKRERTEEHEAERERLKNIRENERPAANLQPSATPSRTSQHSGPLIASPFRLNDRSWGASIQSRDNPHGVEITIGMPIIIRARSGREWSATVHDVEFRGVDYVLVRTQTRSPSSPSQTNPRPIAARYGSNQVVATPERIGEGEWGARIRAEDVPPGIEVVPGLELRMRARSGREWNERVQEVLVRDNGFDLVRTNRQFIGRSVELQNRSPSTVIASPVQLTGNEWGAQIQAGDVPPGVEIAPGLSITVRDHSGRERQATVHEVFFSGPGYFQVRTQRNSSSRSSRNSYRERPTSGRNTHGQRRNYRGHAPRQRSSGERPPSQPPPDDPFEELPF